jgi:hypothetical protein
MDTVTTNIAEKLNKDIEKSVSGNVHGAFVESIESMRGQLEENRAAVKDLGKRLSESRELQQLVEKFDKAYSGIRDALDKAQSAADELQGQKPQQGQKQQSQGSRKK